MAELKDLHKHVFIRFTFFLAVQLHLGVKKTGLQTLIVRSLLNVGTLTLRRDTTDGKGWKTDPVGLETVWVSTNRKYLNLGLVLKMGAMEKDAAPQSIGMMLSRVDTDEAGVRTGHLQLVHSQGDVPEYYSQRVYISLPLQELTVDTLYLTIDTYDGVVRKGFLLSKD